MSEKATTPKVPVRSEYGTGCYRRSIVLKADGIEVRGELDDDFHHFGVRLLHDEQRAVKIDGEEIRVSWTTCPGAVAALRRMEGVFANDWRVYGSLRDFSSSPERIFERV